MKRYLVGLVMGALVMVGSPANATHGEPWEPCMGLKSSQCAYDHLHNDGPLQYNYSFKMESNEQGGIVTTQITHRRAHHLLGLDEPAATAIMVRVWSYLKVRLVP